MLQSHGFLARLAACIGLVLCLAAFPARAEVLVVSGIYPAGVDVAAEVGSISVDRFGGREGPALAMGVEDGLRDVYIQRKPWFAIVPVSTDADAVLRGTADSEVLRENTTLKRNRCVAKDGDGKCTERKDVEVDCIARTVRLRYSTRLISRNGELIYRADDAPQEQLTYCPKDDSNVKTVDETVRQLRTRIVGSIRGALAPVEDQREFRVMESRKGLSGDASNLFRDAVKLTKSDPRAACDKWAEVERLSPGNVSVVFNLGLCAEMEDDLAAAEARYRDALSLSPGRDYPSEGMQRINDRRRAAAQLQAHSRR